MLSPSYNWSRSYSPGYMISNIEKGVSLLRPFNNNYSYVTYCGCKLTAQMDTIQNKYGFILSNSPVVNGLKGWIPNYMDLKQRLSFKMVFILICRAVFKKENKMQVTVFFKYSFLWAWFVLRTLIKVSCQIIQEIIESIKKLF